MKELDAQKLIIDSVRKFKGFGFKLTNRFLNGIPDLLIQIPGFPTSLWEVKINDEPKMARSTVKLDLTRLQQLTLEQYTKAGGIGGVISVMRCQHCIMMGAFGYDIIMYEDPYIKKMRVGKMSHHELRRGTREEDIYNILVGVLRNAERRRNIEAA